LFGEIFLFLSRTSLIESDFFTVFELGFAAKDMQLAVPE